MAKEKFEELKKRAEELREKELSCRLKYLNNTVRCEEKLTHTEISELVDILFKKKAV